MQRARTTISQTELEDIIAPLPKRTCWQYANSIYMRFARDPATNTPMYSIDFVLTNGRFPVSKEVFIKGLLTYCLPRLRALRKVSGMPKPLTEIEGYE